MAVDEALHPKTSRHGLIAALCISMVLVMILTGVLFLLVINEFIVTIRVDGDPSVTLEYADTYTEAGVSATLHGSIVLKEGKDLEVQTKGTVEPCRLGTYEILYTASFGPWSGTSLRKVYVVDTTAPVITLFTNDSRLTQPGQAYREEGYVAMDACDGDLTDRVTVSQGDGTRIYSVTDASGNTATVIRQIRYAAG